jgi:hypothetical protein
VEAAGEGFLVETLDDRLVINKQAEEPSASHQLGVGQVMHDLSHRPLAGCLVSLGLTVPKPLHGSHHRRRSLSESRD